MVSVHGVVLKQPNKEIHQLLSVTYLRSRLLYIRLPVLEKKVSEGLFLTQIVKMVHTFTIGMMRTTPLTTNYTNGVLLLLLLLLFVIGIQAVRHS